MGKRDGSPLATTSGPPTAKRATRRINAGVPPQRLGCEATNPNQSQGSIQVPPRAKSVSNETGASKSKSGETRTTSASMRTSRSVSSTVRKLQIENATEEEIDKLQEQYDNHETAIMLLEFDIKSLLDNILLLNAQSLVINEEEPLKEHQMKIDAEQKTLKEKQQQLDKARIQLSLESKNLERKKKQIRRNADLEKQRAEEEEEESDDNLSQNLSQEEEDPELLKERLDVINRLELQQREDEIVLQRIRLNQQVEETQKKVKAARAMNTETTNNIEKDELLIRLRNLRGPRSTQQQGEGNKSNPSTNTNNINPSDALSDQFVQAITKAFDKLGSSSSNTERFLARQVQGKDLPVFSGRPEEWSIFITAFENSTQGCSYTNMDNLPRLQKAIKGEAFKTIQCLLSKPENVPIIISRLRMRFGRPEHIVQLLINKAREVPSFKEDRLDLLIEFGIAVDNLVETIKSLNCLAHLTSPQLLEEFSRKLPVSLRTKWMEWISSDFTRKEDLETFAIWMSLQTEIACKLCPPKSKEEQPHRKPWEDRKPRRKEEKVWAVKEDSPESKYSNKNPRYPNCAICDGKSHQAHQCRKLEKLDVDERWKTIKSKRLCFCCLKYGHSSRDCKGKKECGQNNCEKPHHPLLHKEQQPPKTVTRKEDSTEEVIGHASGVTRGQINLMILPVQLRGPKGVMKTFAMLDPGATATVIDDEIATKLGLEGELTPFIHSGLHERIEEKNSRSVFLEILNSNGSKSFHLINVRTKKNLHLPQQSVVQQLVKSWKHLRFLPLEYYEQGKPTILIGMDNFQLCTTLEVKLGPRNAPAAGRTELGWVLMGRTNEAYRPEFCGMVFEKTDEELHQLVKQHFTTEAFGVKVTGVNPRSKEDIIAQEIMDNTIRRVGDHWESGLLWKSNDVKLPNTKQLALSRLYQMERRMDRDPEFAKQYIAKIEEYVAKGFARILSPVEAKMENDRTFYLPHFMAKNPKKPKKMRFVFDAAAKVNGVSFNDALLKGPDKLTSLPGILLKFRQRVIGVTADIKDMFHRVKIRKQDACAQRFLWRGMDRDRDPDVLEMGVLIFGAACSPACAQEAKNLNATEYEQMYPEGAKAIIKYHYVDDYLDSIDTVEEAIQKHREVREIHLKGGFNLCNWISNSHELLTSISEELHAPGVKNMDLESDAERVLGLFWKPEADYFTFSTTFLKTSVEMLNNKRLPTKRELLALVMSIYDPLGFLSNFTVKAKMLLQDTWRLGVGWDDEIPKGLQDRWERWNEELQRINSFQLPRCYSSNFSTADEIQLHIKCDASEQAFGAMAYFRIRTRELIEVCFVMSKARVAPTKHLSLPRLELQAALLGARLASFIRAEHEVTIHRTVYWSDNTTVLAWLKSEGARYKQFVACRVGEILETSEPHQWRYVPSKENVSDEMTRESQLSDWSPTSRWLNGPEFLKKNEAEWPQEPIRRKLTTEDDVELKKEFIGVVTEVKSLMDISRFSSYNRAVRSMAYVFRFTQNVKCPTNREGKEELVPEEILKGEKWWWKQAQTESFPAEVDCLKNNKSLSSKSRLFGLNCTLDEDGIMRIHGRLENADLPIATKRPIVLDPSHRITKLLISKFHISGGHHGQERVVNELRQRFYIISIRAAVRKSWNDCQKCKIARAQPVVPQMGQLPSVRLESFVNAFTNTGLDYFGPMIVTIGRRNEKRWGALFTCLSTRAVHVELASSLNTDSCIMAIRRFIARRGSPSHIYSDNGTNFVGANIEMKKALKELNQQQLTEDCSVRGITWHFIPPHAPHMGGSWERLVKSVKVALQATLKEIHPKEEVLKTLMAEAESVVNSHPLTHVPVDPHDPEALTPNHFLIGRSSSEQVPGYFEKADLCLRKQWRQAQQLTNTFWKRWVREYMPTLLRRTKWCQQTEPIRLGDVVLVVDNQLTRKSWPMGLVVTLYPGKDGLVRVVDVKTAHGIYKRPVAKLCKLDVHEPVLQKDINLNSKDDGADN